MAEHRNEDKRSFHRIVRHTNAFAYSGETFTPCQVLDLSLKGCLLELPAGWPDRAAAIDRVEILLNGGRNITMQVTLSHIKDATAGYRCDHIDLDSVTELRRMIELNLGDSALLDRDLKSLVHSGHPPA